MALSGTRPWMENFGTNSDEKSFLIDLIAMSLSYITY